MFAEERKAALALLTMTLGGCVAPEAPTRESLNDYNLPTRSVDNSIPASSELAGLRLDESASASALCQMCFEEKISLCLGDAAIAHGVYDFHHDFKHTDRVIAHCPAGLLEARLIDTPLFEGEANVERKGHLEGTLKGALGISFAADGEFLLTKDERFEQLAFTIAAPAIAGLEIHFSRPYGDPGHALMSFKVEPGIGGKVFGVPQVDTGVHVPIQIGEGGVLSLSLEKGTLESMITQTSVALGGKSFDQTQLRSALNAAAPLQIYAFEKERVFSHLPISEFEKASKVLGLALLFFGHDSFPPLRLLCEDPPGEMSYGSFHLMGNSPDSAFLCAPLNSKVDESIFQYFGSLQLINAERGIYRIDPAELRLHLLSCGKED